MLIKASVHKMVGRQGHILLREGGVELGAAFEAFATMACTETFVVESISSERFTLIISNNNHFLPRLRTVAHQPTKPGGIYRYTFANNAEHFTTPFRALLSAVHWFVIAHPKQCSEQAIEFVKRFKICQQPPVM